ncbi:TSC22 domain family protein 1 isoform X1 [Trichomycterus rosablanca]|uniref:TSC22 domain family protein 1 isoform X1 n=1 Tax=Trichomycterus rosablanca TaxID=2290929 RepID=UPI002F35BBA7
MHHPDSAGDSASARKMAQPASCPRRTSGSSLIVSSGGPSLTSNLMPQEDFKPVALIQPQPPAPISTSTSLAPQHPLPPPHSLSIHSQSTLLPTVVPTAGTQIKKKSGFQITSVTSAQISVSTNNSITEDTESCDDLDESHTEDLSSSEILDMSLSRPNDAAGPERSSSEETLNNLYDAETPGAVSPNQPPILQSHGTMVNGAVHHHHHVQHHQFHSTASGNAQSISTTSSGSHVGILPGGSVVSSITSNPGALPIVDQKMPSNVGGIVDNATVGTTSVIGQSLVGTAQVVSTRMVSAASVATNSVVKPISSNPHFLNSSVLGLGGITTNSSGVAPSTGLNNTSRVSSAITLTTGTNASGSTSVSHMGITDITHPPTAVSVSSTQQAPVPVPHTTSSRFRVVKLDSTSEPFKKGRWTCTDYYDKDAPGSGPSENAPSTRTVESIRHFVPDSVLNSERSLESFSGSSVNSSISTLSHYSESVSSGDIGGTTAVQQSFPPSNQKPDYSIPANVPKPPMQRQDMVHPHLKSAPAAPLPASNQQQASVSMASLQTTAGHPSPAVPPQQLTYAQAAQLTPAQSLPGISPQQMAYPPPPQSAAPAQVAPVHVNSISQGVARPSDFTQPQQIIQVATSGSAQTISHLTTSMPPVALTGNGQALPASKPPVANVPAAVAQSVSQALLQPQQTSAQMAQAKSGGAIPSQLSVEQQVSLSSQGIGAKFVPAVTSSLPSSSMPPNAQSDPQASLAQNGAKDVGAQPAVNSLYANLPSLMATQLEDAQRLLIQHQSLITLPKLAASDSASQSGTSVSLEESGGLTASASLLKNLPVDGEDDSSSGASVVAIDNKIEQAMDLVKSHLMYAVREEVEVLKEQIKELIERNSQLEQENNLLKNLASPEQLAQFQAQVQSGSPPSSMQGAPQSAAPVQQLSAQNSGPAV